MLQFVRLMIGNSSSGIMETASFALPTVNVGLRQKGRERPHNVLDVGAERALILNEIRKASSPEFSQALQGMQNPYGDGNASERIVDVLTHLPDRNKLLMKHAPAQDAS
jgi:UDP-N-acetylglucosamine 2-epimerase (non-hydrolysing)/GDP/UDP-N,N'-diacetylbacillosamine 2-epimerase (hydrolysing)